MMRYLGSLSLHVIFVIISSELFKKPCRSLVQRITIVEFFHRYYLLVHPDHRILLSRVAATMVRGGGECRFDGLAWVVDGVVEVPHQKSRSKKSMPKPPPKWPDFEEVSDRLFQIDFFLASFGSQKKKSRHFVVLTERAKDKLMI